MQIEEGRKGHRKRDGEGGRRKENDKAIVINKTAETTTLPFQKNKNKNKKGDRLTDPNIKKQVPWTPSQ